MQLLVYFYYKLVTMYRHFKRTVSGKESMYYYCDALLGPLHLRKHCAQLHNTSSVFTTSSQVSVHHHLSPQPPPSPHPLHSGNPHTLVSTSLFFFLFHLISPPLHTTLQCHPLTAVILFSVCDSDSIVLVSSFCSLDPTCE